jgi:hypothetical protein
MSAIDYIVRQQEAARARARQQAAEVAQVAAATSAPASADTTDVAR